MVLTGGHFADVAEELQGENRSWIKAKDEKIF